MEIVLKISTIVPAIQFKNNDRMTLIDCHILVLSSFFILNRIGIESDKWTCSSKTVSVKQVCRGRTLNKTSSLFTSNEGEPPRNHLNQLYLFQLLKDRLKKNIHNFIICHKRAKKMRKNCMQKTY